MIADVAMVDGGRNRVLVDGIDITPNDGGALMTEHLTPTQLITLTAVLDAIVDQKSQFHGHSGFARGEASVERGQLYVG